MLSKAVDDIYALGAEGLGSDETVVTMDGFYDGYQAHLEQLASGSPLGYQTGIRVIDENCDGLQP